MSLFHDIQASVLKEDESLASVLLKLRVLASHLESEPLATWIRQELGGVDNQASASWMAAMRIIAA